MIVGFTGTRERLTTAQRYALAALFARLTVTALHHGCCVGADLTAHAIGRTNGYHIVGHPPTVGAFRADVQCDEMRPERDYLIRNTDIVAESDVLIACPKEMTEQPRGGTWSTVRKARKAGKQR